MTDVRLVGIQPENEYGRRFEADAWTWRCLKQLLIVDGFSLEDETAAGLLRAKNGARCSADEASSLEDGLEFLVMNLDPGDEVAATAVSWWRDAEFMDSVDLFDNPDRGISVETIAALLRFFQGSHGFVIRSQMESSDERPIP